MRSLMGVLLVSVLSCSGAVDPSGSSGDFRACFQTSTGVGVVCQAIQDPEVGGDDVDGDGATDPVVCVDGNSDADGECGLGDDVSDGDSLSDSASDGDEDGDELEESDIDSDSDSDADDDGVADPTDCGCMGVDSGVEGEIDLPYDIKMTMGQTYSPVLDAFAEKGAVPATITSIEFDGDGDWRAAELQSGTPFEITQADCDHAGNRDVGRDRVNVTWQNPDGSTETDHLDLRYCEL